MPNKFNRITIRILVFLCAVSTMAGCSRYGEKVTFNNGEVFFKDGATKAEAEKLGNHLVQTGFFGGSRVSVQLTKSNGVYQFRMVVRPDLKLNDTTVAALGMMGPEISRRAFDGAKVEVHLCDKHLQTKKTVPPLAYKIYGEATLCYTDQVKPNEAQGLGDYLTQEGFFAAGNMMTIQLDKSGSAYIFRIIVQPGVSSNPQMMKDFRAMRNELSQKVFIGANVEIHLIEQDLQRITKVTAKG